MRDWILRWLGQITPTPVAPNALSWDEWARPRIDSPATFGRYDQVVCRSEENVHSTICHSAKQSFVRLKIGHQRRICGALWTTGRLQRFDLGAIWIHRSKPRQRAGDAVHEPSQSFADERHTLCQRVVGEYVNEVSDPG